MAKIRTPLDLQNCLDRELSWRIKEIANVKLVARSPRALTTPTVVRAGVALVYAHWEGFVKCAVEDYIVFVGCQRLKYEEAADCFVAMGARRHLAELSGSRRSRLHNAVVGFLRDQIDERLAFGSVSVRTDANLNSSVFEDVALSVGIDLAAYTPKYNLIDESLLRRRNSIAHGEYLELDADAFRDLADEVIVLMRQVKNDLENAASTQSYRR